MVRDTLVSANQELNMALRNGLGLIFHLVVFQIFSAESIEVNIKDVGIINGIIL